MSALRALTNDHQDLRLVSLRAWPGAARIDPRDDAGPYMVAQEGYDPDDLGMTMLEFVLGKSGAWIRVADFVRIPGEQRCREYLFATAAEVLELLMGLPPKPVVLHLDGRSAEAPPNDDDGLGAIFMEGRPAPAQP